MRRPAHQFDRRCTELGRVVLLSEDRARIVRDVAVDVTRLVRTINNVPPSPALCFPLHRQASSSRG
jgi:hypothetical protein